MLFLFTLITFTFAANTSLKIYVFNVGHADSQLLVFPSGYSILIDAGEPTTAKGEAGTNGKYLAKRLEQILKKKKIDVFVLTHYHVDHSGGYQKGGIWYLIEKAGFSFGKFVKRNIGTYSGNALKDCNKNTIKWKNVGLMSSSTAKFVCYANSAVEKTKLSKIGELAKQCNTNQIHPPDKGAEVKIILRDAIGVKDTNGKKLSRNSNGDKYPVAENDFSICMRIVYGKFVYATCGDLSGYNHQVKSTTKSIFHNLESLVAPMIGEVDLAHINHHGMGTSTNAKWCNTLKPTVAFASCSEKTKGPVKKVMNNLNAVKAKVYTTGICNNYKSNSIYKNVVGMNDDIVITVPTNGTKFTVSNSKGEKKKSFTIKQNKKAPTKCERLKAVAK